MKILIADKLAPEGQAFLAGQSGVVVESATGLEGQQLARTLREWDGVVVRSAVQLDQGVIKECMEEPGARLRAIARAGVGVDNIDLNAATHYGIAVMNSASASTITTAEHAFALMIALARNIAPANQTMADGGWGRSTFVGRQLHGRTLGVVGMGRIGRTLADRALAFGMQVIGFDAMINAQSVLDGRVPMISSFEALLSDVDVVSFHVPANPSTLGMLGRDQFALARPGLLVINAARGGIVDEGALLEAIEQGQCGGAAIDVFREEPPPENDPLRRHPKVLTTPHLGASTVEAQEAVAVDACRVLLQYLKGEGLNGAVNVSGLDLSMNQRQRAFVELAERMIPLLLATAKGPGFSSVKFVVRGETLATKADTIARYALASLLNEHLDAPITIINAPSAAEQRGLRSEIVIAADSGEDRFGIEITRDQHVEGVTGAIFEDGLPRITSLNGYAFDMVPAGDMVLLTNEDRPGMIGVVGQCFGAAAVNIAEMVIGRRASGAGGSQVAMMILKLDETPNPDLLESLEQTPGILRVAAVKLPGVTAATSSSARSARTLP